MADASHVPSSCQLGSAYVCARRVRRAPAACASGQGDVSPAGSGRSAVAGRGERPGTGPGDQLRVGDITVVGEVVRRSRQGPGQPRGGGCACRQQPQPVCADEQDRAGPAPDRVEGAGSGRRGAPGARTVRGGNPYPAGGLTATARAPGNRQPGSDNGKAPQAASCAELDNLRAATSPADSAADRAE